MGELEVEKHANYILSVEKVCITLDCKLILVGGQKKKKNCSCHLFPHPFKFWRIFPQKKDSFESVVMEHLRINGAYWGLTTLDLLGKIDAVNSEEVVSWVMKCQHESGM